MGDEPPLRTVEVRVVLEETPSLDVLARIAEALDTSLDHLEFVAFARRPLHAKADVLGDRLADIADLDPDALAALTNVIDGLIAKNRLRALADDVS